MAGVYVALVHHPVLDKHGEVVTTSLTTIDLHDIARTCRTFGVRRFFVVTPVEAMRALARRVVRHWDEGFGAAYNPSRKEAMKLVQLEPDLAGVDIAVEREHGVLPTWVATSARPADGVIGYDVLRRRFAADNRPWLILLGTGWGLADEVLERCPYRLAPILGAGDYNHLSVRAAAAIILDRLLGPG